MKKIVSFFLVLIAILAAPGIVLAEDDPRDRPNETYQPDEFGHTRFWTYYTPYPSNYIGSPEWWQGDAFLGDWWGVRNWMDDGGVEIIANYTTNLAGNPVGGMGPGFTYTDNIYFGAQLDFEKLFGWQGGTLTLSGLDRNGTSLSQKYVGNQFTVQQIYGGQTAMFYALVFEQKLMDDNVAIKVGRFATGDDFASSPIYWLYMNNGIDGNPQALPVNTAFSAYPWAVWAARLKVNPTKETVVQFGIYQASDRIFNREYHGVDWSMRSNDGVLLISQFGWNPEFFKRPVPKIAVADGKQVQEAKGTSKATVNTTMKGYEGHYWFGFYYSPWNYAQFGTTDRSTNAYGFYWHADQMIYQESPGSDEGLTIWSAFVLSPQQSIAKLPFQVNGGLVYKGLLPFRPQDQTMFGAIFGKFSSDYANTVAATGAGYPDYELVFEFGHRLNLNKFLYVQPNVQWVINPGGTHNIPNALVLGSQIGVTF